MGKQKMIKAATAAFTTVKIAVPYSRKALAKFPALFGETVDYINRKKKVLMWDIDHLGDALRVEYRRHERAKLDNKTLLDNGEMARLERSQRKLREELSHWVQLSNRINQCGDAVQNILNAVVRQLGPDGKGADVHTFSSQDGQKNE